MKTRLFIVFWLILAGCLSACTEKKKFSLLDATETGISFNNEIKENDTLNILRYEYLYNGGGVGMGDFNQDGLQDLFFAGNMVDCKLYLNQGEMRFEDITTSAGIDAKKRWCSGVSVVDINRDGRLDIYVSVTMKPAAKERENLLFVNQGNVNQKPVFKEMGAAYGVNDDGYSEHAAFFDYDKDGDLDLYVLTDVIDQSPAMYRPKVTDGSYPNTDRLYRCEWSETLKHPVYKNVSKEAGITIEGFGLGIAICDINRDQWPDIYITNDYVSDDILYINNHDGTFTDQAKKYFKHTSLTAMGNEVNDINNDGMADVVALDMLPQKNQRKKQLMPPNNYQSYLNSDQFGYNYQYMRNTLQLNPGNLGGEEPKPFQEIGLLAGVAETEWSWCPSLADFDNDGYRDLLVTNGYPKDVTDRDFMLYRANEGNVSSESVTLEQIPVIKIPNYAYKNSGKLGFKDVSIEWGFEQASFSNGAAYGDLDNDGDLDYVVNNINDAAFVYRNNTREMEEDKSHYLVLKAKNADGKPVSGAMAYWVEGQYQDGEYFYYEYSPYRGYISSVNPDCHIGLGRNKKIKTLHVVWPNGKMQVIEQPGMDRVLSISQTQANRAYAPLIQSSPAYFSDASLALPTGALHQEYDFVDFNFQNLIPYKLSELGPFAASGDVNGDGLSDVFVGGAKFYSGVFYLQQSNGKFQSKTLEAQLEMPGKLGEDLGVLLEDLDRDGDLDLYIARGGNENKENDPWLQDVIYQNDGKGNFSLVPQALPTFYDSNACVRAGDMDQDGDLDLFVGGRNLPFKYPLAAPSRLLRNDSKPGQLKFTDVSAALPKDLGMICDAQWVDLDGDKALDLALVGDFTPIQLLKNQGAKFQALTETGLSAYVGIWSRIAKADLDGDGDQDLVVGNMGKNTLLRAEPAKPVELVHGDLDDNGVYDVFPFVYFLKEGGGYDSYPLNGKDDVHKMLNTTRGRFVYFKDYGNINQEQFFTEAEKKKAKKLRMNTNASVWIENLGNHAYKLHELPMEAQFSCINGIQILDANKDGHPDILFVGNNFGNEVFVGRYDASNGGLLLGNGKGAFRFAPHSGFMATGNAKDLIALKGAKGQSQFFVTQNRGPFKLFTWN